MIAANIDISDGTEIRIIGTPLDIDRVQQACKKALDHLSERARSDLTNLNLPVTVVVPERDRDAV